MMVLTTPSTDSPLSPASLECMEMHLQGHFRGRIFDLVVTRCEDGVVLRGKSRTYHAKQLAQHVVMARFGVRIVANDIVVT